MLRRMPDHQFLTPHIPMMYTVHRAIRDCHTSFLHQGSQSCRLGQARQRGDRVDHYSRRSSSPRTGGRHLYKIRLAGTGLRPERGNEHSPRETGTVSAGMGLGSRMGGRE